MPETWVGSTRGFLWGFTRRFYWWIAGVVLVGLDVTERVTDKGVSVPAWLMWTVLAVGVVGACIGTYHEIAVSKAETTEQLGHRLREDFRAGVKPADNGVTLVLQKHSLDDYAGIECVVTQGSERWAVERPDPGNASGYGNSALQLVFPSDFSTLVSRSGRNYAVSWIAKRKVGELAIEDTEVATSGFVY